MGTNTGSALDQPTLIEATPKPTGDKELREELHRLALPPTRHTQLDAIRSARQTLITAIIGRITKQRLTAAQAAAVLHLTGPRVTKLLQADIDEFTLDELANLLPALELTIHVVPAPET